MGKIDEVLRFGRFWIRKHYHLTRIQSPGYQRGSGEVIGNGKPNRFDDGLNLQTRILGNSIQHEMASLAGLSKLPLAADLSW